MGNLVPHLVGVHCLAFYDLQALLWFCCHLSHLMVLAVYCEAKHLHDYAVVPQTSTTCQLWVVFAVLRSSPRTVHIARGGVAISSLAAVLQISTLNSMHHLPCSRYRHCVSV